MNDLDSINARLESIEGMLRELIGRGHEEAPVVGDAGVFGEIAQVRAAGGDLVAHFKEKARRRMQQDAEQRKERRKRNV